MELRGVGRSGSVKVAVIAAAAVVVMLLLGGFSAVGAASVPSAVPASTTPFQVTPAAGGAPAWFPTGEFSVGVVCVLQMQWSENNSTLPAVQLTGTLTLQPGDPILLPGGGIQDPLQITGLDLGGGNGTWHLTLNPSMNSTGKLTESKPGSKMFTSFFDVFAALALTNSGGEVLLSNPVGLTFTGTLTVEQGTIAPGGTVDNTSASVVLYDPAGSPVLTVTGGAIAVGLAPCFHYTEFGRLIGGLACNPKANDLEIVFSPSSAAPCTLQWTLNGHNVGGPQQCPTGANDVEVFWSTPPAPAFIAKCVWTVNGKPLAGAPCSVPAVAPANDFAFSGGKIVQVFWTHNGRLLKPPVPVPAGATDVEFFYYSSAYPPGGTDSFLATAVVQLATMSGSPLPTVVLSGSATILRKNASMMTDGLSEIPTQIVSLNLSGTSPLGPVVLTQNPAMQSTGAVLQGGETVDFPAHSFFDVFTDISVGGEPLQNKIPDNMSAPITAIPPAPGTIYSSPPNTPVTLYDPNGTPAAMLTGSYFIAGTPPCFYFTEGGLALGAPSCSPRANDLTVDFTQSATTSCSVQLTTFGNLLGGPQRCPVGANDLEVVWNNTPAGAVITACTWTRGGRALPNAPCLVPATAPANDFTFTASKVVRVFWTLNGKPLKPTIRTPAGANDVEFFSFYTAGYPAPGTVTFNASAVVQLQALNGTPYPAVTLNGTTSVQWGLPDVLTNGTTVLPTKLESMQLSGETPLGQATLTLNPDMPSTGEVVQQGLGSAFPAHSFFDVFTDLSLNGETLHNAEVDNMSATITSIPLTPGTIYAQAPGKPIPFLTPTGAPAVNLQNGFFISGAPPCFFFTWNGSLVGAPTCNPNSNDILVNFNQIPGALCSTQFQLGGAPYGAVDYCPAGANQVDVSYAGSSSGPVITGCVWEVSLVPIGTCPFPSPPQPNGFEFYLAIVTSVSWTVGGQPVGAAIPAPASGANDVEFLF